MFNQLNGESVRKVYEEIINDNANSRKEKESLSIPHRRIPRRIKNYRQKIPFNKLQYFRAILNDDIDLLKTINFTGNDLNTVDQYGWSGLMMAACENSKKAIKFLLDHQVDMSISDSKGHTALTLARRKNNQEIVDILEAKINQCQTTSRNDYDDQDCEVICKTNAIEPFYCDQCQSNFSSITYQQHKTSTLHLFNERNRYKFSQRYGIPDSNVGFQIMVKQGWNREVGLGPRNDGKLFPIKTTIRNARSGFGTKQEPARITHFVAHDRDAVKWRRASASTKPKTRRDICRDVRRNQQRERSIRNELS